MTDAQWPASPELVDDLRNPPLGMTEEFVVRMFARLIALIDEQAETIRDSGKTMPRLRQEARTHCRQGHAFTAANTYLHPDGKRACRACRKVSRHRSEAKKFAQRHRRLAGDLVE